MQTKRFRILVELLKKLDYNSKISETESKIPSISGLATTSELTALEIKYLILAVQFQKQIMTQKLVKLKGTLATIIMINTLLLQNSTSLQQKFLMQDQHEQIQ